MQVHLYLLRLVLTKNINYFNYYFVVIVLPKKPAPSLPVKDESESDTTSEPGGPDKKPAHVAPKEHHPPHKKPVPSLFHKEDSDADQAAEVHRPVPTKKPAAPHKPTIPPKKPLPVKPNKPDITTKKPEKKVEHDKRAAMKKSAEESRGHVDGTSHGKEASKDEANSKPEIKTDHVEEGT